MKDILESVIAETNYDNLGNWCLPSLSSFSADKQLFEYQNQAVRNITKVLYKYFEAESGKQRLFELYKSYGIDSKNYAVEKFAGKNAKINSKFLLFQNHFKVIDSIGNEHISGTNFMNRACFWMATGSGKSLVLIKTIELLDYLQSQSLIPKKEIMLLLPREDLIKQFAREVAEFNKDRDRSIDLVNLKRYEEDKYNLPFDNSIKVYYYRSDLIRDNKKENILDYRSYENNGDWYVFLDEAHRGSKESSLMQDYVSILSKNGFLFNFSATFTDDIDYLTTCYNFNLEKFISAGYGKNLYLSPSYFNFTKDKDDFSEIEKQKQVLKSLIVFALIKKQKIEGLYHHPLLVTLVNSVNTNDADLILLFNKLAEIAKGDIEKRLFVETKKEVAQELSNNNSFVFGNEQLSFDKKLVENIAIQDILQLVFNTTTYGKIEILEGEKGKEIVLKLQTSAKPFALIKIGDTGKFKREQLGTDYTVITSFDSKKYFENINQSEDLNLLLGSRSFYEGWDSNRPNVINMINIGKQDAKKLVLQGIGRGIRIEPRTGERKRLPTTDSDKNILLETLFIFATDKKAVKTIIETVEHEQSEANEREFSLFENEVKPFNLLIPIYRDEANRKQIAKFNIAKQSLVIFKKFIDYLDDNTLLIKTKLAKSELEFLRDGIASESIFQLRDENIYRDMDWLLHRLINHISIKSKAVSGIKKVANEIVHFKHIKVVNFNNEEAVVFKQKVQNVKNFSGIDTKTLESKVKSGELSLANAASLYNAKERENFRNLIITKIAEHYYLPIIYCSEAEKIDYIKHIIKVESEVNFIKELATYSKQNKSKHKWMFSKIDESKDNFYIPYFYKQENAYRKFFPDFIFWIARDNEYKIIFVDPKGTNHTDYQNKVDEFERLFFKDGKPKEFNYKNFKKITFDLKFITDDMNKINSDKYQKYWVKNGNFDFLNLN